MVRVTVYPATLLWAVEESGLEPAAVAAVRGLEGLPEWLDSSEPLRLSYETVIHLGRVLNVPFGSLVRSVIPVEEPERFITVRY